MSDDEAEQWAWEAFAMAHPHEAAEMDFTRFLRFTQSVNPDITEEVCREMLLKTERPEEEG
jgi:hypothetical protein